MKGRKQKMDEKQRESIALFRYGLISNVVSRKLMKGEKAALLRNIANQEHINPLGEKQNISVRSLERYIQLYQEGGFDALKPKRKGSYAARAIPEEVINKAIQLKQERPERSVYQILRMLELANIVKPNQISESTLSKQLRKRGVTRQALKQEQSRKYRRFEFPYRNACWQGDVQHTLYLPHPTGEGKRVTAKLFAFIDDYSRLIVHGEFYLDERGAQLEDCLQKAILRYGKPEKLYVDNGAIYRAKVLDLACAHLGIDLVHSKPGRPEGRGKIERFFRFVDTSFKPEAYDLIESGQIKSVEELNNYFQIWLDMMYHERVHGETRQTPKDRFEESEQSLVYPHLEEIKNAFKWQEERKVDKTGCISFQNNRYEVEQKLVGKMVTLRYDPFDLEILEVWYQGERQEDAVAASLQRHLDNRVSVPNDEEKEKSPSGLNFLTLANNPFQEHKKQQKGRLSYSSLMGGEKHD